MSNNDPIEKLIRSRDDSYGDAWLAAGLMGRVLDLTKIDAIGFTYAVLVILSKIARIASSPTNSDHWKDIAGYATLVFQHLEKLEDANANRNDDEIPF